MTIEVTIAIQVPELSDRMHADRVVAQRLSQFGGELIVWTREINGTPARATYKFQTDAQRDSFLAVALDIPGVSLGAPQG